MFQVTKNVDGVNSTKPLLYAGTVDLVECSIGIQNLFLFFFKGGKFKKIKIWK